MKSGRLEAFRRRLRGLTRRWASPRLALGWRGEDMACRLLRRRGYVIVERRARSRLGEIDIVARDGDVVAFVEVKTRRGRGYGSACEGVTPKKQLQLARLAKVYLARRGLGRSPVRFDVVAVELDEGSKPRVTLSKGAFDAPEALS